VTPGELIRSTRRRHGLSQQRLAHRARTRQSAISRLERDEVSPTVETLELLMSAMGESLQLTAVRREHDFDPLHLEAAAARSPDERLAVAVSWNRMAGRLAAAGREARERA
jgi:transcriptional regulator with XRE-family HTH domain